MSSRRALILALVATALGGMPIWLMGAYSPQIVQTYGLEPATFGAVLAAFFGFSALTGTTIGRYVNTIHWLSGVWWTAVFSVVGLLTLAFIAVNVPPPPVPPPSPLPSFPNPLPPPTPNPPLLPGGALKPTVTITISVDTTLADFDAATQSTFKIGLAAQFDDVDEHFHRRKPVHFTLYCQLKGDNHVPI